MEVDFVDGLASPERKEVQCLCDAEGCRTARNLVQDQGVGFGACQGTVSRWK